MSLRLGFIAAGNMNRVHMQQAKQLGANLVAVMDPLQSALDNAVRDFGFSEAYTDYQELLDSAEIDAVFIASPNKFHAEEAIAALKAGKHVFLEKPMAMNVKQADAIIAAQKKARKIVQIGMVNRFKTASQTLKHFIDAGHCGSIYSGQAFWYRRRGIPGFGTWFTTKEQSGGGALIDIGVHMLDLSLYLMGFPKPVAVSGMTYNTWKTIDNYTYTSMWGKPVPGGKKDVDDYALATIRFDNGATLQLNVSWALNIENMNPEQGLRLMGDKGGVALNGMDKPCLYGENTGYVVDTVPQFTQNNPNTAEVEHFFDCVKTGKTPMATAEQGKVVQSILDAIYRSSAEQKEVKL